MEDERPGPRGADGAPVDGTGTGDDALVGPVGRGTPRVGTLPEVDGEAGAAGGPLVIDGSQGEGGGQILRTAVGLSAALGVDVTVRNIRAGRPKPGLSFQHMAAIDAVAAICGADVIGKTLGSQELVFRPGPVRGGEHSLDIGTAGAVTLVLQAALIAMSRGRDAVTLRLTGGTDVRWAPPADHFIYVTVPLIQMSGMSVIVRLVRRGYYPKGGGMVEVDITPPDIPRSLDLGVRGELTHVHGVAHASGLPRHIPNRMAEAAQERLEQVLWGMDGYKDIEPRVGVIEGGPALDPGTGISLWLRYRNHATPVNDSAANAAPAAPAGVDGTGGADEDVDEDDAPSSFPLLVDMCNEPGPGRGEGRLGVNALGEKGVPAGKVGTGAADGLLSYLNGPGTVDVHTADQLIPFIAIYGGELTCRELTSHARTNLRVVERFMPGRLKTSGGEGWDKVWAEGPFDPRVRGLLEA